MLDNMTKTIAYFKRNGNTRFAIQFVRNGPNNLWLYNQVCIAGLPLLKHTAAPTKNGLKGKPGSMTPRYAIPSNMNPVIFQSQFFIL